VKPAEQVTLYQRERNAKKKKSHYTPFSVFQEKHARHKKGKGLNQPKPAANRGGRVSRGGTGTSTRFTLEARISNSLRSGDSIKKGKPHNKPNFEPTGVQGRRVGKFSKITSMGEVGGKSGERDPGLL